MPETDTSENPSDLLRPSEGGTPTVDLLPPLDSREVNFLYYFNQLVGRQTGVDINALTVIRINREEGYAMPNRDYESPNWEAVRRETESVDKANVRLEERQTEVRKSPPVYAVNPDGYRIVWIADSGGLATLYTLRLIDPTGSEIIEATQIWRDTRIRGSYHGKGFIYTSGENSEGPYISCDLTKNGKIERSIFIKTNEKQKKKRIASVIDSLPTNFQLA